MTKALDIISISVYNIYKKAGDFTEKLKIAICDDEKCMRDYLESLIIEWSTTAAISVQISQFCNSESFLFEYEENKDFDILLLDIQMSDLSGLELAERVRAHDSDVRIIFITGFSDYISRGYDLNALHYLIKPIEKEKLFEVLFKAAEAVKKEEKHILVQSDGGCLKVKLSDIFYIEAFGHECVINLKERQITSKLSFSKIERLLGDGFVHTHRSYIVNLEKVSGITAAEAFLENGKKVPVSRRLYTALNKAFIELYRGVNK